MGLTRDLLDSSLAISSSHQTELNFKPLRKLEFGPPSQQKEIIRCIHATTTTTPNTLPMPTTLHTEDITHKFSQFSILIRISSVKIEANVLLRSGGGEVPVQCITLN